jgi:hypothetical protein
MNLTTKALLVQLNISQWSARKYDKKVTSNVNKQNNASDSAGRFNKALLPAADKLNEIHKMSTKIRNEYYRQTLPWGMEGTMLLPTTNYLDFMADFKAMKNDWERLVDDFVAQYPALVSAAQQELGMLYDQDDYPPVDVVRDKFNMGLSVMPVPSNDFRVEIQDEELAKIKADVESRVKKAEQAAMGELWQRLYDRVKHIAERLSDPDAKFKASLLENAWDLCDILPKLNVADDSNLEQMRTELQAMLRGKNPDVLRTSPAVREDTAKKAQDIVNKMNVFMTGV